MTRNWSPLAEPLQQVDRTSVRYRGRKLIYFGGCDYFRLASHPDVLAALRDGVARFGLNVAASRFTTGNHVVYERLERAVRRFFDAETATLVSSGYLTNLILAQALAGEFTRAFIDSRAHQSLQDCVQFLGCPVTEYPHADVAALTAALRKRRSKSRVLLLTDGMFSHNGTIAPLGDYLALLPRGSKIVVDDAHGAGTLGKSGRGTCEALEIRSNHIIRTISLSKAFGVYGGAILGPMALREKILERSRILRGNTPLPLPLASAAIRGLALLRADTSLRRRLLNNIAFVKESLSNRKASDHAELTPVLAVCPNSPAKARLLRKRLLAARIYPTEISYADEQVYFRFALSSEHEHKHLERLVSVLQVFSP